MSISRRRFLQTIALTGLGSVLPSTAGAVARGEELATLLDIGKCIGCGECVAACREANQHKYPDPQKPFPKMYPDRVKVADWSHRQDVDDRLTPYNWLYIQYADVTWQGKEYELTIPRRCLHCTNPPCANLCPWGAALKQDNGIVRINDTICLGGSKCQSVCPWHIPQRQTGVGLYLHLAPSFAGNGVMYKCDRCYDRINKGEIPACITACPENVQTIGPRGEIIAMAHALAEKINGFIYGETENGGTNTLYVSPVPFEEIDKVIDKGPGRPGFQPVANAMAPEDKLLRALIFAPAAGVAAGILHTVRALHQDEHKGDDHAKD
jgi:Fe-S-cluster-containing dehydrogenase component